MKANSLTQFNSNFSGQIIPVQFGDQFHLKTSTQWEISYKEEFTLLNSPKSYASMKILFYQPNFLLSPIDLVFGPTFYRTHYQILLYHYGEYNPHKRHHPTANHSPS
mmetsp:Transcript_54703/g.82828  ORF Transcript_54703/g.82828 Transcript_54703/m.82828 type:complete len:107 (-) Transcript_54703:48-368(-)